MLKRIEKMLKWTKKQLAECRGTELNWNHKFEYTGEYWHPDAKDAKDFDWSNNRKRTCINCGKCEQARYFANSSGDALISFR